MIDQIEELAPKEQKLLTALMSERTIAKAAEAAGISEATAYRYLKRPEFARLYREMRQEALSTATARLQAEAAASVATLAEVRDDLETARPSDRITAARVILDYAFRADDLEAISALLDELKGA